MGLPEREKGSVKMDKVFDGEKWVPGRVSFRVYTREIWVEFADGEAECEWFFETHVKRAQNYYEKLCKNPPKNAVLIYYNHNGQTIAACRVG